MDPDVMKEYVTLVLMVLVFGVPAVAIAARLALRPIVDAIVRLREISAPNPAANDARVAALEAEVNRLSQQVQRLSEADTFNRQLNAPKS
jgi:HAMP domain-containing protein